MACSRDTDGDGDCGRIGCPECGGGPVAQARFTAMARRIGKAARNQVLAEGYGMLAPAGPLNQFDQSAADQKRLDDWSEQQRRYLEHAKRCIASYPQYPVTMFRGVPVDQLDKPELVILIGRLIQQLDSKGAA